MTDKAKTDDVREAVARIEAFLAPIRGFIRQEGRTLHLADLRKILALITPAPAGVATWHPIDDNGNAEVRVNGQRITSMPSYGGAEDVASRINAALTSAAEPVARPLAMGGQHTTPADFPPDDVLECVRRAEALDEGAAGEREQRLSAALIALVEHFERVDAGPEDKAAIQAACQVWADVKREKALSAHPSPPLDAPGMWAHEDDMVEHTHPQFGQGYFCTGDTFVEVVPPTAADEDRMRIAVEAERAISGADVANIRHSDGGVALAKKVVNLKAAVQALAALKSTAAQEGVKS